MRGIGVVCIWDEQEEEFGDKYESEEWEERNNAIFHNLGVYTQSKEQFYIYELSGAGM